MKDDKNIMVTGGLPEGTFKGNVGEPTEEEEKTIRIAVMNANELLNNKKRGNHD